MMKAKFKNALLFVLDIILNVIILFAFVFIIREFLVAPFQISGPSMCNTLNNYNGECQTGFGEYVILNKLGYLNIAGLKIGEPKRYDIIVFHPPHDDKIFYIKRIIGMPGETVEINNGKVFVNGEELYEPYLSEENAGATKSYKKALFEVPEDQYLAFGDNRNKSTDARTCFKETANGCSSPEASAYLTMDRIQGKAWVVLWPFNLARVIDYPENSEKTDP